MAVLFTGLCWRNRGKRAVTETILIDKVGYSHKKHVMQYSGIINKIKP